MCAAIPDIETTHFDIFCKNGVRHGTTKAQPF